MEILQAIGDWIVGFFGFDDLMEFLENKTFADFLTYDGIKVLIRPLFPITLVLEMARGLLFKSFGLGNYKIPFFSYVLNAFIGRYLSLGMTAICIGFFEPKALFHISFTWYWFIYGYIVWEFAHFIYHYLAHKVRLFWCLHSTHHAPENMNLAVSYAHFFLEGPYADIIRASICILAGLPPAMLFAIMFIDGTWGAFIHIGDHLVKDARMGKLGNFMLSPAHHRVHHARNVQYMDTNFCNLLNIWDRVFKTYQPELDDVKVEYGITREMKPNHFLDAYFGELLALAKDVYHAPGLVNKFLYIFMPPGWSHTGLHKTATAMKKEAGIG
ncbi:sterol desaturase family protein [Aquirufa ecclesiirivi]|uniref:sterol desaturase family protein n=1 Tax=Aquirufa ecclesiirivi TaxID=2715124 RepID=UPI0022A87918|nr:sterol desaturase family protein [Aquirufa ecclesiirivi]MCZ2473282.1 sterol desaturase family protein [Aquirufa ecclesiirivi]MDF0692534.1 sterol desaturase family protein [Aquirufa ecclesiirivi]